MFYNIYSLPGTGCLIEIIMRTIKIIFCFAIFLLGFSCVNKIAESAEKQAQQNRPGIKKSIAFKKKKLTYALGEILVKFVQGTDKQTIEAVRKQLHLTIIRPLSIPDLYLMKIINRSTVEAVIKQLKDFKEVSYSEPNYRHKVDSK